MTKCTLDFIFHTVLQGILQNIRGILCLYLHMRAAFICTPDALPLLQHHQASPQLHAHFSIWTIRILSPATFNYTAIALSNVGRLGCNTIHKKHLVIYCATLQVLNQILHQGYKPGCLPYKPHSEHHVTTVNHQNWGCTMCMTLHFIIFTTLSARFSSTTLGWTLTPQTITLQLYDHEYYTCLLVYL